MKLTKRNIDALPTPEKRHYVYDDELSGFALSVLPTERKTFVAHYRVGGGRTGRQRRVTIGVYGKIGLEEARAEAKDILAKAHLGEDVADKRDEIRASQSVSQLIDAWSKDGVLLNRRTGAARKQVNINNEIALANHHLRRLLGSRTVDSLTKGDIKRLRVQIEDVHIHDLRHTFASVGAGGGVGLPLIGGILGHRQASTTQRYAHLADGPLRTAADLIGSELAAAPDGASLRSRTNPETVGAGT